MSVCSVTLIVTIATQQCVPEFECEYSSNKNNPCCQCQIAFFVVNTNINIILQNLFFSLKPFLFVCTWGPMIGGRCFDLKVLTAICHAWSQAEPNRRNGVLGMCSFTGGGNSVE